MKIKYSTHNVTKKEVMKISKTKFPHLIKEWHPYKNGDEVLEDFSHGSKRKVWWQCENNHQWNASIVNRTNGGTGCPICAGKNQRIEQLDRSDLNLIRYILDNKPELKPADIAKITEVSLPTVSRWKFGAPIPEKSMKKLLKMADLNILDLENTDFAILVKAGKVDKNWLEYMEFLLTKVGIEVKNKKGENDSNIVSEIKKMYVTLNRIGVPIDQAKTFPPRIDESSPSDQTEQEVSNDPDTTIEESQFLSSKNINVQKSYTAFDSLASKFIENYADLIKFYDEKIWSKKMQDHQKISQVVLKKYAIKIALSHIDIKDYELANSDRPEVLNFFHRTKIEAINMINEFCLNLKEINEPINFDYFDFINKHPNDLKTVISIIDIEDEKETINKYLSFGERAILDGIEKNKEKLEKNNELLNIILMRLDNQ